MREINYTKIGKRIKKLREERGMTQSELGAVSGVDVRRISAIENGRSIRLDSFIWLAVALESSADYIVFGTAGKDGTRTGADIGWMLDALDEIRDFLESCRGR